MAHKRWLHIGLLMLLMIGIFAFAWTVAAQTPGDQDGDGLPDTADRCPAQAGPRENGGCPVRVDPMADRDSDGVADFVDACPDQAGTGFTNGCPVEAFTTPPAAVTPQVYIYWESMEECMYGLPFGSPSPVNVREYPTVNSAVIGQIVPGYQWSPWFRDYDENNEVWLAGAFVNGQFGWVKGSAVINNGQCVNLPQVIHVDMPNDEPVIVEFDPSIIPTEIEEDDGFSWEDLFDGDIIVIIDEPEEGDVTPMPQARGDGGPRVRVFSGQTGDSSAFGLLLPAVLGEANPPSENQGDPVPSDQLSLNFAKITFVTENNGECPTLMGDLCLNAMLLLPASGPAGEACPPDAVLDTLLGLVGDPFVGDPFDVASPEDMDSLIGLLLPAVQKWANAGQLPQAHGTGGAGAGKVSYSDLHIMFMGDGSVVPGNANVVLGDGSVRSIDQCPGILLVPVLPLDGSQWGGEVDFNLLLPAVRQ